MYHVHQIRKNMKYPALLNYKIFDKECIYNVLKNFNALIASIKKWTFLSNGHLSYNYFKFYCEYYLQLSNIIFKSLVLIGSALK